MCHNWRFRCRWYWWKSSWRDDTGGPQTLPIVPMFFGSMWEATAGDRTKGLEGLCLFYYNALFTHIVSCIVHRTIVILPFTVGYFVTKYHPLHKLQEANQSEPTFLNFLLALITIKSFSVFIHCVFNHIWKSFLYNHSKYNIGNPNNS